MDNNVKVTVNPSPSSEVVAKALAETSITDAKNRTIKLKKPGVLAQYRLIEVVGDSAKNETYMNMVLPIIFVSAIDDDPVFQPSSKGELEALIQRLEEDGVTAVMNGVAQHFGPQNAEADKATLKK